MPEVFLSGIVPNVLRYALKSCDCFMMATTAQMVKMEQTETIQRTEQIVKIVQMEKMLRRRMEKMDAAELMVLTEAQAQPTKMTEPVSEVLVLLMCQLRRVVGCYLRRCFVLEAANLGADDVLPGMLPEYADAAWT